MSWRGNGSDSDGGWARAAVRARRGARGLIADALAVAAFATVLFVLWWF